MLKKITVTVAACATIFATLTVFAAPAQETVEARRTEISQKREDAKATVTEKRDEKCESLTKKVELTLTRFSNNKDRHIATYTKISEKVKDINTRLKDKGYDISKLQADEQTLNEKIKKIGADYALFIEKLDKTKGLACGQSNGEFKTALQDAQAELKIVREDILATRLFYQTTMRADIQSLKQQTPTAPTKTTK
ncbi:MAG: hypothetical protein WCP97_06310 [bacterium]